MPDEEDYTGELVWCALHNRALTEEETLAIFQGKDPREIPGCVAFQGEFDAQAEAEVVSSRERP